MPVHPDFNVKDRLLDPGHFTKEDEENRGVDFGSEGDHLKFGTVWQALVFTYYLGRKLKDQYGTSIYTGFEAPEYVQMQGG